MVDAFAIDLDGTLLDAGESIAPATLDVLATAVADGIQVFIVTGRPEPDVRRILDRAGLGAAPFPHALICEERDIHERTGVGFVARQPRNDQRHAAEYALSLRLWPALQGCLPALAALDPPMDLFDDATVRRRGFSELHFTTAPLARQAATLLTAALGGQARIVRNHRLVALRLPSTGKGPVLSELAVDRRLDPGRILAIGDSDNDRDMLNGSHGFLAAVPANADSDLRAVVAARGGYVSRAERSLGVAEAVHAALGGLKQAPVGHASFPDRLKP